ncbi:S9 family peptidase [Streptomyces sp. OF3]|uniref:S9 family peptidase n=1 Tax=Streptomyces alkaliterrae TaxID=2213162 RepID=A0A7W3ZNG1_9ACTN|nr:prolyl oligopeptidase family serine peptidase [Streptomyces alkaliterrae]MBB1254545.1 S9 family peptidase [Streptomyces alkaliterrae]
MPNDDVAKSTPQPADRTAPEAASLTRGSFPREHARTLRFTLGAPRSFTVAPDGSRMVFLRSASGTDRANRLWVRDLTAAASGEPAGAERVAADPAVLLGGADERLSAEERARRERSREGGAGIVGYATDAAVELAAFALSGRLFTAELRAGTTRELPVPAPVLDPRPAPDGRRVGYVADGTLRIVDVESGEDRALAEPEGPEVTYGLAEFIAAEETHRTRGFWWSPEGDRLLVARVDESPVRRWWIADPANPDSRPSEVAYPAAGTPNAEVRLFLLSVSGGQRTEVVWDRAAHPYLAAVHWSSAGAPLLLVQSRDQRHQRHLTVDLGTGATTTVHEEKDPGWLELIPGTPAWTPDGRLLRVGDEDGARALYAGDRRLTDPALHVRAVLDTGPEDVLFSASTGEIADVAVYRVRHQGGKPGAAERLTGPGPVHASAVRGGEVLVTVTARLDHPGSRVEIRTPAGTSPLASHAHTPSLTARPNLRLAGERRIPAAVLLPTGHRPDDGPLPVLMDPYGGPHGQMVVGAHNAYLGSQWFADQGFAVIVADGRGTPGRSPEWEKAIRNDFAGVTLDDQVHALHALAEEFPLDLDRVAIRGWSYGGYLAALAVLRRPDVFHAAVAGAPVTDWRLYDTHYTERYLGDPNEQPEVYRANSLVTSEGLGEAAEPHRPLMLIHGLADDNVVAAHTLRLSSALLAAGRPHEVLPLSGVTHMTPQEQVAENLLLLQVDFLRRSLQL